MYLKKRLRNQDIDVLKGMLVVSMIIYHCASMGRQMNPELKIITSSMYFVHFAFIIISGYLCSWHYASQLKVSGKSVRKRLRVRSFKILVIFIIANVFLYQNGIFFYYDKLAAAVGTWGGVSKNFILQMNGDLVAFEILYYIAIFIFFISFLIGRATTGTVFSLILLLSFLGRYSDTVLFTCCGMIGFLCGTLAHGKQITAYWQKFINYLWLVPIFHLLFFASFSIIRDIRSTLYFTNPFLISLESFLYFAEFLLISRFVGTFVNYVIILFGKYTLIAYLAQMVIVRIGFVVISRFIGDGFTYYFLNLLFSSLVLLLMIWILDRSRIRYSIINKTYKMVFN